MKKKLLSLALTLVMCLGLTPVAFAENGSVYTYQTDEYEITNMYSIDDEWDGFGPGCPASGIAPMKITAQKNLYVISVSIPILNEEGTLIDERDFGEIDAPKPGDTLTLSEPGDYFISITWDEKKLGGNGWAAIAVTVYDSVDSLQSVGKGETTPVDPGATSGEQYMIPGLEEYVTFSNPYVGTDKGMAFVGSSPEQEEVTIYEFPVGTKLRLTEKAINSGYRMVDLSSSDESGIDLTELSLVNATTWRNTIWIASNNDPMGVTLYLRPVNPEVAFTDVKTDEYYQDAVHWAVKYGITSGTSATTFSPNSTCTNAQILTFLWRANGSPEPINANTFTDIKTTDFYYKAALWAAEKGLVSGSTFDANAKCTRAMTMEYMWKAAGSPATSSKVSFTDVPANADYAQAVAWAVESEITSGTGGGNFSPNSTCTRGQIVTFLYRAMGK